MTNATPVPWGDFAAAEPDLARFGIERMTSLPAYLATIRRSGAPRVHPVTPIFAEAALFLFMEPTSPKVRDLVERRSYALHSGVPDNAGTGGEFWVSGIAARIDDPRVRSEAAMAASYEPDTEYVLLELMVGEARCNGYGDVSLPATRRWASP